MVDLPDPLMHGQNPKKQSYKTRDETIESIKTLLASKGLDDKQSFAFIRLDEDGKVRVHASGQVKGFLDEQSMDSMFQEAYAKAVHDAFIMPEPTSAISIDEDEASDYGDDEFPLVTQAFGGSQASRVYRTARQRADRGRSMLPCNASRHCPVESNSEPEQARDASPSEPEEEPSPVKQPKKVSKSLRIDNSEEVCNFLVQRLRKMQQLAVKKIAKAWIKGICPKKQAKFPYQNKKGEETPGFMPRVPGWWPDTSSCRFIEPDHIRRDERMRLCLHLLRLRPTPAQLKEWNEDKSEPHPTHVAHGWTAFLKELAGVSIFEELQKEDKKRTESKKELLTQMYRVAALEEEYLNGEIGRFPDARSDMIPALTSEADGANVHNWTEEEEEKRSIPAKRPLQSAVDFKVERASRESSESVEFRQAKRSRRNSVLDGQSQLPEDDTSEGPHQTRFSNAAFNMKANQVLPPSANELFTSGDHTNDHYDAAPMKRDSSADGRWRHVEPSQAQWMDNPVPQHGLPTPNNQFVMPHQYQAGPQVPSNFGSHQGYAYPQHQEQPHMVQVHQVSHIPEPQFQTVSNAPMYSPSGMMPMPLNNFVPQECSAPAPQQFTNNMAPNHQYFLPTNADPAVAEFHAPMTQPYQSHHELAKQHIAPMGIQGLPFTQPSSWEGRPYHNPT